MRSVFRKYKEIIKVSEALIVYVVDHHSTKLGEFCSCNSNEYHK